MTTLTISTPHLTRSLIDNIQQRKPNSLRLDGCNLTYGRVLLLCEALGKFKNLWGVSICNAGLLSFPTKSITEALRHHSGLESLILTDNNIGKVGAKSIASFLLKSESLTELDVSNNPIADEGMAALIGAVGESPSLLVFRMARVRCTAAVIPNLVQMLLDTKTLHVLDVSNNNFVDEDVAALGAALRRNSTLRYLHVDGLYMSDASAILLADVLSHHPTLWYLNFMSFAITVKGVLALVHAVETHSRKVEVTMHQAGFFKSAAERRLVRLRVLAFMVSASLVVSQPVASAKFVRKDGDCAVMTRVLGWMLG